LPRASQAVGLQDGRYHTLQPAVVLLLLR
jgi:hypothetical protein